MDDRDLNAPLASLHEEREEFDDAAECHIREGNMLKAIELFLLNYRRRQSRHSLSRAVTCILDSLWLYMSLGAPDSNWESEAVVALLEHAEVVFLLLHDDILRSEVYDQLRHSFWISYRIDTAYFYWYYYLYFIIIIL